MESAGAKNRYTCEVCRGHIVTVNRREGVTPFMLACRATQGCKGLMQSACYRIDQGLPASFEWYGPSPVEARALDDAMLGHVLNGGLLIRAIGG